MTLETDSFSNQRIGFFYYFRNMNPKKILRTITCILFIVSRVQGQCPFFYDGFESGSLGAAWTAGSGYTTTFNSTNPAVGNLALQLSGTSPFFSGPSATFGPSQPTYISWWGMTNTVTPGSGAGYFILGDNNTQGNNGIVFAYFAPGFLRFYNTSAYDYPTTALTWLHIELKNINWTNKSFDIYINGTLWQSNFAFRSLTSTSASKLYLHNYTNATAYYDDIQVGTVPTISVSLTPSLTCSGSQATLTAMGSATSYSWSGGVTNSIGFVPGVSGVYTVTASYGTGSIVCQNTETITVSVAPISTITIVASRDTVCPGIPVILTATGASSYSWTSGSTQPSITVFPAASTNYSLTGVGVNSCVASGSIQINTFPLPQPTITAHSNTVCQGESILLTASGASSYTWSTGAFSNTIVISPQNSSTFTVTGANLFACTNAVNFNVVVSECTGINESSLAEREISVFPNPNAGEFTLVSPVSSVLIIQNSLGEIVKELSMGVQTAVKLEMPSGVYFISGKISDRSMRVKVIVLR